MIKFTKSDDLMNELGLGVDMFVSHQPTFAEMTEEYASVYYNARRITFEAEGKILNGEEIPEADKAKIKEAADIIYRDGYKGVKLKSELK